MSSQLYSFKDYNIRDKTESLIHHNKEKETQVIGFLFFITLFTPAVGLEPTTS